MQNSISSNTCVTAQQEEGRSFWLQFELSFLRLSTSSKNNLKGLFLVFFLSLSWQFLSFCLSLSLSHGNSFFLSHGNSFRLSLSLSFSLSHGNSFRLSLFLSLSHSNSFCMSLSHGNFFFLSLFLMATLSVSLSFQGQKKEIVDAPRFSPERENGATQFARIKRKGERGKSCLRCHLPSSLTHTHIHDS